MFMYTQIQQFTPLIIIIMSTSKTPQDFEQTTAKKGNSTQQSKIQEVINTSGDHKKELLLEQITKKKETDEEATSSSRNDDGYKTPTSPGNRIPSPVQCPPAPRKPVATKLKRKAEPPAACRRLQFDEPADVESIFRAVIDEDNVEDMKTKKARRTEED